MTRIVCHRGACHHAPENTIASGLAAARLGGDIVELDVRQSGDGVLYVLHDATLERTTNGLGPIVEMHSRDLDRLDAGTWFNPTFTGEPLPRLARMLDALKDRVGFYVEVKSGDADAVAHAILSADVADNTFTYSETAQIRDEMATAAPWLRRMINWNDITGVKEARDLGAAILEFHAPDLTQERLSQARAVGMQVMVHTPLKDEALFEQGIRARVDYLNIDFPEIAARLRSEFQ